MPQAVFLAGVTTFFVAVVATNALLLRVEQAYVFGASVAGALMAGFLRQRMRTHAVTHEVLADVVVPDYLEP